MLISTTSNSIWRIFDKYLKNIYKPEQSITICLHKIFYKIKLCINHLQKSFKISSLFHIHVIFFKNHFTSFSINNSWKIFKFCHPRCQICNFNSPWVGFHMNKMHIDKVKMIMKKTQHDWLHNWSKHTPNLFGFLEENPLRFLFFWSKILHF